MVPNWKWETIISSPKELNNFSLISQKRQRERKPFSRFLEIVIFLLMVIFIGKESFENGYEVFSWNQMTRD